MEILNRVKRLGVKISLQKGNIDIKAPKGVLNQELIDEIKSNKFKIISHLSKKEKISNKKRCAVEN